MSNRFKSALPYLLLAIAVALVFANSLEAEFIYDDLAFVANNEAIRTFTPLSKFLLSPEAFSQPANDHVYRPLVSFSFAVNHALGGLDVRGYHLTNLLFHAINVFLVFALLRLIGLDEGASFVGALIFAIHPAHVEAVTWISGRGNVLFLTFFLLSLLLYARIDSVPGARRAFLLGAAAVAYAISLLAKEMALPLPGLLFGYDLYFRRERDLKWRLRRLWMYVPFALVAIVYIALRTSVLGKVGQVEYHGGSAYMTFLVMLKAFAIYAKLLFLPVGLSLSRHFQPSYSIFEPDVFVSLCLVLAAIGVGVAAFRRSPLVSFGLFWFAVAIVPVSNIIPVNAIVADRFLYGPSIGFSIIAAAWFSAACGAERRRRTVAAAALAPAVFCLMLLSINRNNEFDNPILLWQKTAESSPSSFIAYNNMGLEYLKEGALPEAIEAFEKAIEIKDNFYQARLGLAMCYMNKGDTNMAIRQYEDAFAQMDDADARISARLQLAGQLEDRRRISQAIEQYEAALAEDASVLEAHNRLATLYAARDTARAIGHLLETLKLTPDDADPNYLLGRLYHEQNDQRNALKFLRAALSINPNHDAARRLLDELKENE